jgi:hypothetical protein
VIPISCHGVYKPGNVKLHPELLSKHQKYVKEQTGSSSDKPGEGVLDGQDVLGLSVEGVVVNILVVDTVLLTTGDTAPLPLASVTFTVSTSPATSSSTPSSSRSTRSTSMSVSTLTLTTP